MKTKPYLPLMGRQAVIICLVTAILLMTWGAVFAGNFTSPPTLYLSSQDSTSPTTAYTAPLDPRNSASFSIQYQAPIQADPYTQLFDFYPFNSSTNNHRKYFYGDDTVTESQNFSYTGNRETVALSATPGTFEAKSRIHSWCLSDLPGSDAFTGALSSVGHYFVVNGPTSGESIQLVADVLFQGRVFANRNGGDPSNANAYFTNILGVVAAPTDPTPIPQYPLYVNGAATDQGWIGNTHETIPNFIFPADGLPHDVNVIIRSRPFTVKTGVPYRMNLNINASAGANYRGAESYVDFFDPKIVTSFDFTTVKDQYGQNVTLSPSGFFLKESSTILTPLGPGSPSGYTMSLLRNPVRIDILPWLPNIISLWPNWGIIPVSILSAKNLNAPKMVDEHSLTFGATGDEQSFAFCDRLNLDINRDRYRDLTCYFLKEHAGFECGNTTGILKGKTVDGMFIEGKDSVKVIPCK